MSERTFSVVGFVTEKLTLIKIKQTWITEEYQTLTADVIDKINTFILYTLCTVEVLGAVFLFFFYNFVWTVGNNKNKKYAKDPNF